MKNRPNMYNFVRSGLGSISSYGHKIVDWVKPRNNVNYLESLWRLYNIIIGAFSNYWVGFKNLRRYTKLISNDRVSQAHQQNKLHQTSMMHVWHHNRGISDFQPKGSILKIVVETQNQFQMIEWVTPTNKVTYVKRLWCI